MSYKFNTITNSLYYNGSPVYEFVWGHLDKWVNYARNEKHQIEWIIELVKKDVHIILRRAKFGDNLILYDNNIEKDFDYIFMLLSNNYFKKIIVYVREKYFGQYREFFDIIDNMIKSHVIIVLI